MYSVNALVEQLLDEKKALPDSLKDDKFKKGETEESKNATDAEKKKKGKPAAEIED